MEPQTQLRTKPQKTNLLAVFSRFAGALKIRWRLQTGQFKNVLRSEHYQYLHDQFQPYMENNWLVEDLQPLTRVTRGSICEVGCGNGKFLRAASPHFAQVTGMDWAKSAQHADNPANVTFIQADLSKGLPDGAGPFDLICSADFLEHLQRPAVEKLIKDMHAQGRVNYHKIACYDDGGSHVTLLSPQNWLKIFLQHSDAYRLIGVYDRRNNGQEVAVITNADILSPN